MIFVTGEFCHSSNRGVDILALFTAPILYHEPLSLRYHTMSPHARHGWLIPGKDLLQQTNVHKYQVAWVAYKQHTYK